MVNLCKSILSILLISFGYLTFPNPTWGLSVPVQNPEAEEDWADLPKWVIPQGLEPYVLGYQSNHKALAGVLEPYHILEGDAGGEFFVTNARAEKHLNSIRNQLDDSRDHDQQRGALWLLQERNYELFRKFLALGVDPDVPDKSGNRLSHMCSSVHSTPCVADLALCRVNHTAEQERGETPLDSVRRSMFGNDPEVEAIWMDVAKNGNQSLAKMASNKNWHAVQNVLRRRLVDPKELSQQYEGKKAVEWAFEDGRAGLAAEMIYYLTEPDKDEETREKSCQVDSLDAKVCGLESKVTDIGVALGALGSKMDSIVSKLEALASGSHGNRERDCAESTNSNKND